MSAEAIARLRAYADFEWAVGKGEPVVMRNDLRALLDAHMALEHQNATLRLLVAGLTIAVDMEPSADPLEEPWVRLVEAAHKHGRKLERADEPARTAAAVAAARQAGITETYYLAMKAMLDGSNDPVDLRVAIHALEAERDALRAQLREQRARDRELALRAATLFINMMTPGEPFGTSDMSRFDSCLRSVWGAP